MNQFCDIWSCSDVYLRVDFRAVYKSNIFVPNHYLLISTDLISTVYYMLISLGFVQGHRTGALWSIQLRVDLQRLKGWKFTIWRHVLHNIEALLGGFNHFLCSNNMHTYYVYIYICILVGGFKHLFSTIYGKILSIDFLIFFEMVIAPPSRSWSTMTSCCDGTGMMNPFPLTKPWFFVGDFHIIGTYIGTRNRGYLI